VAGSGIALIRRGATSNAPLLSEGALSAMRNSSRSPADNPGKVGPNIDPKLLSMSNVVGGMVAPIPLAGVDGMT
jgi:hypothetical protein